MTAITLPLKKIPGQSTRLPTFFGGRKITAPMVLLFTIPFNTYLYIPLSRDMMLIYSLIGLLPYFYGLVSIIYYIQESRRMVDKMIEANLEGAEKIFIESKVDFRKILVSNCFSSMIMMAVFSYLLLAYGMLPLFIVGFSSIMSVGIAVASIISRYELRMMLTFIFIAFAFEAAFLFLILRGQWKLGVILPVVSFMFVYSCLRRVKGYDLRSFLERVIN